MRVLELAGLGPVPFAATMLADLGAEVVRVDRPAAAMGMEFADAESEILFRGRRSICLDLSQAGGRDVLLRMCESADVLLEGNRPGVMERLGVGPEQCAAANPALIYARSTGWGQDGPLSPRAGHDINYTAVSGALEAIGEPGRKPVPTLNLISDFGGGGAFLVIGVVSALLERVRSGRGQVVDSAMVDGVSYLLASIFTMHNVGTWSLERGSNLLDGGAPFYDTYQCSDGRYVAIGALEPKFWRCFVETADVPVDPDTQWDRRTWPELRKLLEDVFRSRTRDEWAALLEGVDACVSPVLSVAEAPSHRHLVSRRTHLTRGAGAEPAPAPRFSRTTTTADSRSERAGASTTQVLTEYGFGSAEIDRLAGEQAIFQAMKESV
ncbi:CaiB/BaiF CoA transferase family protein [Nocardia carnea]|uniref:CaiB/BaiF CoA transferase family protein n=1 Tax=Nocardia carnea TaxID=37328 RepID=UPI002455113F|nr:CaiB/BaiF CoA-transferase family protein [Nocardia carnea]